MSSLKHATAFLRELVAEQIEYRHLLYEITARDVRLRYKQALMGFGWAIFMPVLNTAIFAVIFTRMAPIDTGVPYVLFAFTGLLAWQLTASSLRFAVISLTSNTTLVTKVYFPREIFPFSAIAVTLVDTAVAALLLVAMLVYYRVVPTTAVFFLPVVLVTQLAFTAGCALLLAMANLFFRDVKYLFEVVLSVWMFASSAIYPIDRLGGRLGAVLSLNPLTPIINAYRDVLLFGRLPDAVTFATTMALSGVILLVAWAVFHRAEFRFAENV